MDKNEYESTREFDLNVENILENWEVYHAIREIIANALDEQIITKTPAISIYKSSDSCWHIVDYGRGLNYHHLTQNENEEKLKNPKLIGRFGVGLKDTLATLYRHNIKVRISSKYGVITLKQASKAGFEDIITLHANISAPENADMTGTDFCLQGCTDEDIKKAKALFLAFSGNEILESTSYGDVLSRNSKSADIYINGVKVSEEPNFLFSYNITSLTAKLKKALNRERANVGRSAYTDRVKTILMECKQKIVIQKLVDDLQAFSLGTRHDELTWQDVQLHVSDQLRKLQANTAFVTTADIQDDPDTIEEMKRGGLHPVIIPENILNRIEDINKGAKNGETFTTAKQYLADRQASFHPIVIEEAALTAQERSIYEKTEELLRCIGGRPKQVNEIQIVEKIYDVEPTSTETLGLYDISKHKILIKRNQLKSLTAYAGTLLHECAHAISGANDTSRDFEDELTDMIGLLAARLVSL